MVKINNYLIKNYDLIKSLSIFRSFFRLKLDQYKHINLAGNSVVLIFDQFQQPIVNILRNFDTQLNIYQMSKRQIAKDMTSNFEFNLVAI